ncbi:hypothetical protein GCM10010276_11670 [Streptomyces longisporus]|uniref:Uncharacterized protein n=1 Tax=Streptomyces longisporus TaxID=1948 RepID=A0ABN3L738_STRLO
MSAVGSVSSPKSGGVVWASGPQWRSEVLAAGGTSSMTQDPKEGEPSKLKDQRDTSESDPDVDDDGPDEGMRATA